MSLLIKGMNMPKSCSDCAMRYMAIGYDWECVFTNDDVRDYDQKRLSNCPLTEITSPHGRLIDADRLIKALEKQWNVDDDQDFANKTVWREIESAPTVIEKEMN